MRAISLLFSCVAVALLASCGGGSDSSAPAPAPAPTPTPAPTPPPAGIGSAGGTVSGPAGAQVVIPANALSTNVAITVTQSAAGSPALPAARAAAGDVFALTPHGTTFAAPVTITVPFNPAAVPAGGTPSLWKTNAAQTGWEEVAGATVSGSAMSGQVTSFSWVVVTYAAAVAPTITTQPASVSVVAGQSASFSVVADGSGPFTYQWRRNGSDIAGATAATYSFTTALGDTGARFAVVVTNGAGSVTSNEATLTVSEAAVAPTITTAPAPQTVTAGQPATFTVVAAGTAPLAYQWRRNGADIAGATSASYTLATTTLADNAAQFSVLVSNAAGSVASAAATLTVNAPGGLGVPALLDERAFVVNPAEARSVVDDAGNATVVWAQLTGGPNFQKGLYARRFNAGTNAWEAERRLDLGSADFSVAAPPAMAVDAEGNVMAVWTERPSRVLAVRYAASSGQWSTAVPISALDFTSAPAVTFDAQGDAMIMFSADDPALAGSQQRMHFVRYSSAGNSFTPPVQIESYAGSVIDSGRAALAVNASGNAIAVWSRADAFGGVNVFARYTASSNTWSTPAQYGVVNAVAGLQYDDQGNGLVLSNNGFWRFPASGGADRTLGIAAGIQLTPLNTQMVARPDGGAVAVTMVVTNNLFTARVRYYDRATNTWTVPADVIADAAVRNVGPSMLLAGARNGEAVLLLERAGLQALRLPAASTTWGAPRLVRAGAATTVTLASAAVDITGRSVHTWTETLAGSTAPLDLWGNVLAP
jgi:hypothetical protein